MLNCGGQSTSDIEHLSDEGSQSSWRGCPYSRARLESVYLAVAQYQDPELMTVEARLTPVVEPLPLGVINSGIIWGRKM